MASSTELVLCDGKPESMRLALAFSTSNKNPTADKLPRLCSGLPAHWLCYVSKKTFCLWKLQEARNYETDESRDPRDLSPAFYAWRLSTRQ